MGCHNNENKNMCEYEDEYSSEEEDDEKQSPQPIISRTEEKGPLMIIFILIFIMIHLLVSMVYVKTTDIDKTHFSCNYTDLMMPKDEFDKVSSNLSEHKYKISAVQTTMTLDNSIYNFLLETLKSLESTYQKIKEVYDYEKSLQDKCDFIKTIAIKKLAFKNFEFLRCIFVPFYVVITFLYGILSYREWNERRGMSREHQFLRRTILLIYSFVFITNVFGVYTMFDNEEIWSLVESKLKEGKV